MVQEFIFRDEIRTHNEMFTDAREAITSGLAINRMLHLSLCHIVKTSTLLKTFQRTICILDQKEC